ncbi:TonB-dependent receptor [Kaistella palustris]|uniref:TonB-dependent receptor n=1 Tax=Kaistella palustris TaxID=493376 RepID=UPI00040BAE68|nr:TonB-dependent receptor [Kaistella palustris]
MKIRKLNVAVLFLLSTTTVVYGQIKIGAAPREENIEGVALKGSVKKGSENNIISLQRKSVEVIERVGSAQLEKQGIGDAATAVTKASGTQKQEGSGQIFIRGLGDRYNATSLNGLPIPSDNPEFKNIDLGIFKTSVIEYISLDKVYNPKFSGDFGGANINIVSKEHSGKPYFKVGIGSRVNLQTFDKNHFKLQAGGPGFFGYKETTFRKGNPNVQYPFTTRWNFKNAANPFNSNMDIEGGATLGKLSVFGYAGFENGYVYSAGKEGFYDATGDAIKALDVDRYTYSTNSTALVNLAYKINTSHKISYTTNFVHSSAQDARFFRGYMREIGTDIIINRGDNKLTSTLINQLYGNHKITGSWAADWGVSYNRMDSKRPDRLQNTFDAISLNLIAASTINNHRYFDALTDNTLNGFINISKQVEDLKINFGYSASSKDRQFDNTTIGLNFDIQTPVNPDNVDAFINASNNGIIRYNTFRNDNERYDPFYYHFKQNIQAGFANVDYKFSDRLVVQLGGRFDHVDLQSKWDDAIFGKDKSNKTYNKFLPALNAKYSLDDRQNIRFSASKTYTLPQAKELVPTGYYDVTTNVYGNPFLSPSDNYNVDLKWELFGKAGEVFSVTAFGKYIENPIARTTFSTAASSDMTYFNIANSGVVAGAEMEFRKDIYKSGNSRLYTFLNATYMHSNQKLKTEAEFAKENGGKTVQFNGQKTDAMQGVADFLANINLGYTQKFRSENTVDFVISYSYVGKSLYALGTNKTGNFYESPIHLLDANLKFNFKQIGVGVTAKNLINSDNKIEQMIGEVGYTNRSYTKGREIGLNLSYEF